MPSKGQTPAKRKASADYHKRRKDAGMVKATVWLTPEAADVLARLANVYGSKDKALNAAILAAEAEAPAPK